MKQIQLFLLAMVLGTVTLWAQPVISSFSPATGGTGTTVTINGSGFNTTSANNIVYFGAAQATVTAASATQLTVTSPTSVSGSAKIMVLNTGTNLIGESKKHFIPTFPYGISTSAASSTQFVSQATGTNAGPNLNGESTGRHSGKKLVSGDFDGDGKIDYIAMGTMSSNSITIYRNVNSTAGAGISASTFSSSTMSIDANSYGISNYSYDLNNDGKLDVLIGRTDGFTVLVNTSSSGSISFSKTTYTPTGTFASATVKAADMDKDGKLDVVGIYPDNWGGGVVSVYQNTSSGGTIGFNTTPTNISLSYRTGDVVLGDLDNDGDNEIVTSTNYTFGSGLEKIYYYNNTNSTPGTMSISGTASTINGSIPGGDYDWNITMALADFDADGDLDITYVNKGTCSPTAVFVGTNNGGGSFTCFGVGTWSEFYSLTYCTRVGDINGDGKLDIVFHEGNSGGGIKVIMNTYTSGTLSASSFSTYSNLSTNYALPIGWVLDDFNQDGKIDVIYNGYQNANMFYCTNGNAIYFAKASGASALNTLSNWSSTLDGTGSAPANFTSGNFVLDNTQGTTSFNTGGAWTFGAALGIPSGKKLTIANNSTWTLSGTVDNSGYVVGGTGSTLQFSTSAASTFNGNAKFVNLTQGGTSAQITLSGNDTVTGTFTNNSGRQVVIGSSGRLVVQGTFSNSGTFSCTAGGTLEMNGSSAQTLGGLSNIISNLIINNTAGVSLGVTSTVNTTLSFTNGLLKLGNFDLNYNGSTVSSAGSGKYVQTNGTGRMKMSIGNNITKTFPVGFNNYNPVGITNNTGTSDVFGVLTLADVYYNGASGVVCVDPHVRCTWDINKTNANAGSGVGLKFYWTRAQESGNMIPSWPVPGVQHHDGTNWTNTTFTNQLLYDTTTSLFSLDHQNYSGSFSPFAVGSFLNPLPVKLFDFTAAAEGNKVALNWKVSEENTGSAYEVLHSSNGSVWNSIASLNGQNTDQAINVYNFKQTNPETVNYYKVKMTDAKNNISFSQVERVLFDARNNTNILYLFPNPSNGQVTFNVAESSVYTLTDASGRVVKTGSAHGETVLSDLAVGVYALSVNNNNHVETIQIIVK
jgi:hypothetical protein